MLLAIIKTTMKPGGSVNWHYVFLLRLCQEKNICPYAFTNRLLKNRNGF